MFIDKKYIYISTGYPHIDCDDLPKLYIDFFTMKPYSKHKSMDRYVFHFEIGIFSRTLTFNLYWYK